MQRHLLIVLGSFLLFTLTAACGDDTTGTDGNGGPQPIVSGSWSATAGFGSFTFEVSGGTSITEISYSFSGFSCGGVTTSGTVTVGSGSGWSITNRSFTIVNSISPIGGTEVMTITGTFADNGTEASGSYSAAWHGSTCTGSWNGSS
jgi:hypothetical protein